MKNLNHLPDIFNKFVNLQISLQPKLQHLQGYDSLIYQLKAYYFHGNSVQVLTIDLGGIF